MVIRPLFSDKSKNQRILRNFVTSSAVLTVLMFVVMPFLPEPWGLFVDLPTPEDGALVLHRLVFIVLLLILLFIGCFMVKTIAQMVFLTVVLTGAYGLVYGALIPTEFNFSDFRLADIALFVRHYYYVFLRWYLHVIFLSAVNLVLVLVAAGRR